MFEKDTDQLFDELKIEKDVENFLVANQSEFTKPLHEFLNQLLQKKNLSKTEIIQKLNFDKKHAYHIFNGSKQPSRNKLLAIAIAMNLNFDDTQYLLRYAGFGVLYPRDPYDAVIIYAIEHNLSLSETDRYLEQLGELPLNS